MATDDFGIVMSVLNENLQEGLVESKPVPKAEAGDSPPIESGAEESKSTTKAGRLTNMFIQYYKLAILL